MPKNIVVFSDGSGQAGGRTVDTNIYKLFRAIENRARDKI